MDYQIIDTIKRAAENRLVLKIDYMEKDGTREGWRYVEPYSFSHDSGDDALFAWDTSKQGIRRLVLSRIERIEITDRGFTPRFRIETYWG